MNQKELYKIIGLSLIALLTSLVGWMFMELVFTDLEFTLALPSLRMLWNFIWALIFLFFSLAIFGIISALESRNLFKLIMSLALPLTLLLVIGLNLYTLIGAGLWVVGFLQFGYKVREERNERTKVSINKYLRHGLGLLISSMILAISISFYGTAITRGAEKMDPVDVLAKFSTNGVNQFLTMQLPGYNPEMTLDEFLFFVFANQFKGSLPEVQAQELPENNADEFNSETLLGIDISDLLKDLEGVSPQEMEEILPPGFFEQIKNDPALITGVYQSIQDEVIGQQIASAREELLKSLDIEAQGTDPVGSVIEQALKVQLNGIFRPFKYLIPPILALTIYFLLQIFGFIYVWIVRLMAVLVYGLLKVTRFFRIDTETVKSQVIKL